MNGLAEGSEVKTGALNKQRGQIQMPSRSRQVPPLCEEAEGDKRVTGTVKKEEECAPRGEC